MKTISSNCRTVLLALLMPIISFSQKKWDNQIAIGHTNLGEVVQAMTSLGYTIKKYDSANEYLSTDIKLVGGHPLALRLKVYQKEDSIYLSGDYQELVVSFHFIPVSEQQKRFYPICYFRSKLNNSKVCWDEMMKIATKLGNVFSFAKV
ncbi:MAG TPA: hypothetical protein VG890_03385 [Puia sp.]|nr:hypothetical protein [Puia sp.]